MDIKNLIIELTPLYNEYRKNRETNTPVQQIILMWKIGDILKNFIDQNDIAPHALYREIYGKSESSSNVSQRSYMTREFLGRSYRVRNMFKTQKEIKKTFPNLTGFSHFREAMPFFDNPKHKLSDKDNEALLDLLNGTQPDAIKTKQVKQLLKKKIGKKNPRTQRLADWQEEKEIFINFYNEIFRVVRECDYKESESVLSSPQSPFVKQLARNTGALSADGLKMNDMEILDTISPLWHPYVELVAKLISKENPIERRRFRRLIPADRFVRLSEMLYALTDEQSFNNLKAK
jgi:hypothetical protein